jgi:hypothetical protein
MSTDPSPESDDSRMHWQVLAGVADLAQAVAGVLIRLTEHSGCLSHSGGQAPAVVWKGVSLLARELGQELEQFSARIHEDPSKATFDELEQLALRMGRHMDGFWMAVHTDVDLMPYMRPKLKTDLSLAFDELMGRISRSDGNPASRSPTDGGPPDG